MGTRGGHAVVLGASMSGLLAARVLTEFYDEVTLVERDELDDGPTPRRGVPQSRQPHVVLARCAQIMEDLFSGILDEMISAGAHQWSDGDLSRHYTRFGGHLATRSGCVAEETLRHILYASRPFIESHVRRRTRALPDVSVLDRTGVNSLTWSGRTVTGVRVTDRMSGAARDVAADLVVDATGRGSRVPFFLEQMGFARPQEREMVVNVSYVSVPVRIPDGTLHENLFIDMFDAGRNRGFALSRCEHDGWSMLIGTLGRDVIPPASVAELMVDAEQVMPSHAYRALREAEIMGDVALHRFPASRWRRYDRLTRFPERLLVTGDAVCSFNPIYGQGMTIAALDAITLRECLSSRHIDIERRFHRAVARDVAVAWRSAVGSDLALPEVAGHRSVSTKAINAFIDRILLAAETDPWVCEEFLKVTGMLKPPTSLLRPSMVRRLIRARGHSAESLSQSGFPATA